MAGSEKRSEAVFFLPDSAGARADHRPAAAVGLFEAAGNARPSPNISGPENEESLRPDV
jgi:hypothetical protein